MKRFLTLLTALLLTALPALAAESLVLTAVVEPVTTLAVKAPASGELAPFTLREGDRPCEGSTLFAIEPISVYADMEGTVDAVHIAPGDIAEAITERYGAVIYLDHARRYVINASVRSGYNSVENRDLHVGVPVYLRSSDEKHTADGVITHVDGLSFTVEVLGGDLEYNDEVKIFRDSDYGNKTLLGRGNQSYLSPRGILASGTIISVSVQQGDAVKPGDELFRYVPDAIAPERRGAADATAVKAEEGWLIASVRVEPGASVQKGQVLCTVLREGDYELTAQADEADLPRLNPGDTMTVRFEELDLPTAEASLVSINPIGTNEGGVSRYTVRFSLPDSLRTRVWPGMHATLER